MNKLKYIDLFAGAGGLSEGFMQTNMYNEIAAVEWLKQPAETLRNRLKNKWKIKDADKRVLNFDISRENELINGWNDKRYGIGIGLDKLIKLSGGIDVIIGGPPCQAYSIAGRVRDANGMKNDYRNYLFEHYLNIVKRYHPKAFVFENVPGMLSAKPDGELITEKIKRGFSNIGFEIIDDLKKFALINTEDFGVPQSRKRVIIVGLQKKLINKEYDIQKILQQYYKEYLSQYKQNKKMTVKEAIGDLKKFEPIDVTDKKKSYRPQKNDYSPEVSWHIPRYHNKRDKKIFNMLAKDIENGDNLYTNSAALSKLYNEQIGSNSPIHRYHVLRPDKPSTTIIAHLYKDGNRFIHYDSVQSRTITPREAARLQSFPDDFEFIGSQGAVYQMIGNAVPPKLSFYIAKSLKDLIYDYLM